MAAVVVADTVTERDRQRDDTRRIGTRSSSARLYRNGRTRACDPNITKYCARLGQLTALSVTCPGLSEDYGFGMLLTHTQGSLG